MKLTHFLSQSPSHYGQPCPNRSSTDLLSFHTHVSSLHVLLSSEPVKPVLILIFIAHTFYANQPFIFTFYSKGLEILKDIKKHINAGLFYRDFSVLWRALSPFFSQVLSSANKPGFPYA